MDPDFYMLSQQVYSDLSYLKSLNAITLEYLVGKFTFLVSLISFLYRLVKYAEIPLTIWSQFSSPITWTSLVEFPVILKMREYR